MKKSFDHKEDSFAVKYVRKNKPTRDVEVTIFNLYPRLNCPFRCVLFIQKILIRKDWWNFVKNLLINQWVMNNGIVAGSGLREWERNLSIFYIFLKQNRKRFFYEKRNVNLTLLFDLSFSIASLCDSINQIVFRSYCCSELTV